MTAAPGMLWLAAPTRLAALPRGRARLIAALLLVALAGSLAALAVPGPPAVSHQPSSRASDRADVVLYETIVAGVRAGGDYYAVTARALRAGGYPLRPFVTFRLPTLATIEAHLTPAATIALLYALALAILVAWFVRFRPVVARPTVALIATALVAGGMASAVQADLAAFHEVWAGLLIALSLALWAPDRWAGSVAAGLAAMLLRETAALYAAVMLLTALTDRRRGEALAWIAALAALAIVVLFHAGAVAAVVRADDVASPGWAGMLGIGFALQAVVLTTALALLPIALAAPLAVLALAGWAAWRDPRAIRVFATLLAYLALVSLFGRVDTFYWALLVAPVALAGLVFVPDALRDLARAAR